MLSKLSKINIIFIIFITLCYPMRSWSLSYPQLWQIAQTSLEHNIITLDSGSYLRAGPKHFGSLWTRDFCFSIKGLMAIGKTEVVKNHLSKLINLRSPFYHAGLVPRVLDNISSSRRVLAHTTLPFLSAPELSDPLNPEYLGEHKTVAIDSNALVVLGAIAYLNHTQDWDWWNQHRNGIIEIYQFYLGHLDNGLVQQAEYADWQDSVKRAGKSFFVNFLYWKASKELAKIEPQIMPENKLNDLKSNIFRVFFDTQTQLFRSIEDLPFISLDAILLALDDEDFLNEVQRNHLYQALTKHPLWTLNSIPGFASFPDYPSNWRSLTTQIVGLSHYHDRMYWSWLMGLAGKIAAKYGDSPKANSIFERLQELAIRDNAISEIYKPTPGLERFEAVFYRSSIPFSWGSAVILEALNSL